MHMINLAQYSLCINITKICIIGMIGNALRLIIRKLKHYSDIVRQSSRTHDVQNCVMIIIHWPKTMFINKRCSFPRRRLVKHVITINSWSQNPSIQLRSYFTGENTRAGNITVAQRGSSSFCVFASNMSNIVKSCTVGQKLVQVER